MKISVLHPSRGRAPPTGATVVEWLGKASGLHAKRVLPNSHLIVTVTDTPA